MGRGGSWLFRAKGQVPAYLVCQCPGSTLDTDCVYILLKAVVFPLQRGTILLAESHHAHVVVDVALHMALLTEQHNVV